uniref:RecA family profile 1 domain-containing protein n=1 Tax=Glossina palpalis gambiensis TaxID=67801 RepID=A0A1B0B5W2_9MUSC
MKLIAIDNTELSEYSISLLNRCYIHTVNNFLNEKTEKLKNILKLKEEQVDDLKKLLRQRFGPTKIKLAQLYSRWESNGCLYKTGISNLDSMLGGESLQSGSVWEMCGPSGVGKTQWALSVAINFVISKGLQVLYIDTKLDLSAIRIKQMLQSRYMINAEMHAGIMQLIKVERCLSAQGVINMLENFEREMEYKNPRVMKTNLIIIDSLPAVWLLLKANEDCLSGKWLLSRLNNLIYKLAQKYYVAIIIINLSVPIIADGQLNKNFNRTQHGEENDDLYGENAYSQEIILAQYGKLRPMLGRYWQSIPRLRLSLDYGSKMPDEDVTLRYIRILNSCYTTVNLKCPVHLTAKGII